MFYRIIVKGDVFKFNLMNYKHRYLFLAKLKNNKIRKILLFTLLSCEILFNSTLLLLLFFTTTRSMRYFLKNIAFILTMIMFFFNI
jgi:NADH:ubiquinone oxidoreductase subunit K